MFLTQLQKSQKKLIDYLNELKVGKVLFIFDHGLGDYVMFINIFEYLIEQYPNIEFKLGYNEKFEYDFLHENMYELKQVENFTFSQIYFGKKVTEKYNIKELEKEFDIVVDLIFPETPRNLTKMDLCFQQEIGYKNKLCPNAGTYKIYKNSISEIENNNRIGIHCVTNTGVKAKSLTMAECHTIWNVFTELGYNPVIFHSTFKASNPEYLQYNFNWVPKQSLINCNNVPDLMKEIAECKYFYGVLSGPLCLAQNILGDERCVSILKQRYSIQTYLHNTKIPTIRTVSKDQIQKTLNILNENKFDTLYIEPDKQSEKIPELKSNTVVVNGEVYEVIKTRPKQHPALEGLEGEERILKIRELNRRGIAPTLETKLIKKPLNRNMGNNT